MSRILILFLRGRVAILYITKAVESRLCIERICRVKFHAAEAMEKSRTSQTFYSLLSHSLRKADSLITTLLLEQTETSSELHGEHCMFTLSSKVVRFLCMIMLTSVALHSSSFGCIVLRSHA